MTAFSDETGRERVTADMLRAARRKAPKFWRDYDGSEQQMRAVIEAALSASPVAQEPVAWQLRQCPRVFWTSWRRCSREDYELVQKTGVFGDAPAQSRQLFPSSPPATPAGLGADEKCATYRNALLWAFDRLTVTGGMNADEQRRTMREIGNVLTGKTSPAATYQPNDWDDSTALLSRAGDQSNSTHEEQSTQNI